MKIIALLQDRSRERHLANGPRPRLLLLRGRGKSRANPANPSHLDQVGVWAVYPKADSRRITTTCGHYQRFNCPSFCALFGFDNRETRYVLEQGHVPKGVEQSPNTGHHRQFGPGHSFWLAIVLKLKQAGVKTPVAADVADYTNRAIQAVTQNLVWDMPFLPAEGYFDTDTSILHRRRRFSIHAFGHRFLPRVRKASTNSIG